MKRVDKNPIIKKVAVPFKSLKSLAAPYAGNCADDHEKLSIQGNCNCDCDCRCNCDCYETEDCDCDCLQSFCDCNCVCDCGALNGGSLFIQKGARKIFPSTYQGRSEISEVIFPEGLELIGERAFRECGNLQKIVLPEGLKTIDADAFGGCERLAEVSFPSTPLTLEGWAFRGCGFKELSLPDGITELHDKPFEGCRALKRVYIGKGLRTFGGAAFLECSHLTEFVVDEENPYFKAIDGVLFSKDGSTLYCYPMGKKDKEYTVPDGVTTIGRYAFYKNKYLDKVFFPNGMTTIEYAAFQWAVVSEVSLPKSMRLIENYGFGFCKELVTVYFRGKRKDFHIKQDGSWVFPVNKHGERATLRTDGDGAWGI